MDKQNERWSSHELAEKYLSFVREAIPYANDQIKIMLMLINACKFESINFLDLGCGDGVLGRAILERFPQSEGILIDFNEEMVKQATKKATNYAERVAIIQANYTTSEWLQSILTFSPPNVIISGFSIHHQTDERIKELYTEFYNILKPGGIFLNIEHVASENRWLQDIFDNYFIDSLYSVLQSKNIQKTREEVAREYFNKEEHDLTSAVKQCDWLRDTGFSDVDIYFKVLEIAIFGGRKL